jgi:hypothetical protein
VGGGPKRDAPRARQNLVERRECPDSVERDDEFVVHRPHCQRMPYLGCDIGVDRDDFFRVSAGDAQEHHAVPAGIHFDEIVAVRRRQAQRDAAALILFAAGRLYADADLRILGRSGFVDCEEVVAGCRRASLFERDSGGGRWVFDQGPRKLLSFSRRQEVEMSRWGSQVPSDVNYGFWFQRPCHGQHARKECSGEQHRKEARSAGDGWRGFEAELSGEAWR